MFIISFQIYLFIFTSQVSFVSLICISIWGLYVLYEVSVWVEVWCFILYSMCMVIFYIFFFLEPAVLETRSKVMRQRRNTLAQMPVSSVFWKFIADVQQQKVPFTFLAWSQFAVWHMYFPYLISSFFDSVIPM